MLPAAILLGALFYKFFSAIAFLSPYVIFFILFLTYCRFSLHEFRFTKLHFKLIGFQLLASAILYLLLDKIDTTLAQGVMICILVPTAMSAPVVTGMLGGNVVFVATYTLLGNTVVALIAPLLFSAIGTHGELPFLSALMQICQRVVPLLITPFILALLVGKYLPRVNNKIKQYPSLTFYLWNIGLMLVTGKTVYFIATQSGDHYHEEIVIALVVLCICIFQFLIGKKLGNKCGERIAAGQALGQKNTILAIWMAQAYLNPLASIGPASYVLWQNSINSFQMWLYERKNNRIE